MKAGDVTDTLELALQASGCDQAKVVHKPRLLSDNGPCYISADLADFLQSKGMGHGEVLRTICYLTGDVCIAERAQTQGKIAFQRCKQRLPANGDAGIKPSKTASYWKITSCREISSKTSKLSSNITIIVDTMRASTI